MKPAMEGDEPAIRARLEAEGFGDIRFDTSYGFIVGVAAMAPRRIGVTTRKQDWSEEFDERRGRPISADDLVTSFLIAAAPD